MGVSEGGDKRGYRGRYVGMKRSSIETNLEIREIRACGSTVGRAMREADSFRRAMFLSGLKSRIWPCGFL